MFAVGEKVVDQDRPWQTECERQNPAWQQFPADEPQDFLAGHGEVIIEPAKVAAGKEGDRGGWRGHNKQESDPPRHRGQRERQKVVERIAKPARKGPKHGRHSSRTGPSLS